MTDQRCSRCHGQTVDDQSRIEIVVAPQAGERRSTHVDGIVSPGTG